MKVKITADLMVDISDQRAHERYGTTDVYTVAAAMTMEATTHSEEIKRDMQSSDMTVEHVSVVVIPLHG